MSRVLRQFALVMVSLAGACSLATAQDVSSDWTSVLDNQSWTTSSNWTGNDYARGGDQFARFINNQTLSTTNINLNSSITIGNLVFDNGNWNIATAQNNVLTLSVSPPQTPTIEVRNQSATISARIDGNQGLRKLASGTLILSGANIYTGTTTISGGVVNIRNANALGGATGGATNGTVVSSGAALQIQGGITTAAEALTLNGSGVSADGALRNISGNNTYTGAITLGSASTIQSDSGTLTLDVASGSAISATNQNVTFSGSGNVTVADSIAIGNGTITKLGSGTLTLSGNSSFTGVTTVSSGVLNIRNAGALGDTTGGTSVTAGAALQIQGGITTGAESLTLNGSGVSTDGALRNISGNNTYSGAITLGSASTIQSDSGTLTLDVASGNAISGTNQSITFSGNGNVTVADAISLGNGSLTKLGGGTLTLSSANSYSGGTTWGDAAASNASSAAGIISVGNNAAFGTGTLTVRNSGTMNGGNWIQSTDGNARTISNNITIAGSGINFNTSGTGDLRFTGAVDVGATGTRNFNVANSLTEFSGALSGAANLAKGSSGTLVLSGANTYTGTTAVSGGTLQLGNGSTTGSLSTNSAISVASGATFAVNRSNTVTQGTDFSGTAISGAGGFTQAGSGTTVLTAANTYAGNTTVSNGTLQLGNGSTTGSLSTSSAISVESGATFAVNRNNLVTQGTDFSTAAISGAGGFTQAGSGTTVLTAANSYTGNTTVSNGTLQLGNGGANGSLSTSSAISVLSGATFAVNRNNLVTQGTDFSAAAIGGAGGFTQAGSGTTVLTAANTYTGNTTVSNGTLQLGNGGANGSLSTSSAISVSSGATFAVNRSNLVTQGTDFSGAAITGAGGFTQAGTGTTVLTANNSYTGATNVNAGTLRINGNQVAATGAVTVANNATLGGSGTVGGATTFQAGSTHSPGNSPGLQTFNAGLTYNTGSSLKWELVANSSSLGLRGQANGYDGINVTGGTLTIQNGVTSDLVFDGSLNAPTGSLVRWSDAFWATAQSWLVYQNASMPTLASGSIFTINSNYVDGGGNLLSAIRAGSGFSWSQVGSNIFLNYTPGVAAVPEPGTFGLMGIVGLVAAYRHKRRKASSQT